MLNDFISYKLEDTIQLSTLPDSVLPDILRQYKNIRSWQRVNNNGNVIFSYPDSSLVGISFSALRIYQQALQTNEDQIEILPYSIDNNKAALAIAHPGDNGVSIAIFSFQSVLKKISDRNNFFVYSDDRGNIILSNYFNNLNLSTALYSNRTTYFSLPDLAYVTSKYLPSLPIKVYLVYNISNVIKEALLMGLMIIAIIILVSWVFIYIRKNFNIILEDMNLLENTSKQLTETIRSNKYNFTPKYS